MFREQTNFLVDGYLRLKYCFIFEIIIKQKKTNTKRKKRWDYRIQMYISRNKKRIAAS